MLHYWNSQDVIPGWAIAKQQRLAALQKTREKHALAKAFLFGMLMASAYVIILESFLR